MPDPIVIKVLSDTRSGIRGIKGASGEVSRFGSVARKTLKGVAVAGAVAAAALVKLGIDAAQSAADDQRGQARLATTLKASTGARAKDVAGIERWITAQGKAFGVTDDDLRPAISRLATATGSLTKARKLASLAENVAEGRGKSLTTVTEAIAKAQLGSLGGLSRLGVRTKTQAGNTRNLDAVMKDLAKTYRGAAAKGADTLSGKLEISKVRMQEAKETAGAALIPILSDLASMFADKVVPAIEDGADWLKKNRGEIKEAAGELKDSLLPRLQELYGIGKSVVDVVSSLPGPVRDFGLQAAGAAFLLPKLTGAVGFLKAGLGDYSGAAKDAEKRTAALQRTAKTAAGIGGLLLLSRSVNETNDGLATLEQVGGAALAGFSLGGPIGGVVGLLGGLAFAVKKSSDQAKLAAPKWDGYAGSLNDVTGAITRATRAQAVQALADSDAFSTASKLGISRQTLVSASLGELDALAKVDRARQAERSTIASLVAQQDALIEKARQARSRGGDQLTARQISALQSEIDARKKNLGLIDTTIGSLADQRRQQREQIRLVTDWSKELKGLPDRAITHVEAQGIPFTLKGIARLTDRYKLTPKQIRTVLKVAEVDKSVRDVRRMQAELKKTGDTQPNFSRFQRGVALEVDGARTKARAGADRIADELKKGTGKAKPDFGPFLSSLVRQVQGSRRPASVGGEEVGQALKRGILLGFEGTQSLLASQAAAAVRAAVTAAKAEGRIHSPSKEAEDVGAMLGEGLAVGLRKKAPAVVRVVRSFMGQLRAAFVETAEGPALAAVNGSIATLTDTVQKATDRQQAAAERAYEREYRARQKSLKKTYDGKDLQRRLAALEAEHDKHLRKLEAKYDKLAKLRVRGLADEKKAVRDAATAYDTVAASLASWTDELAARRGVLADHIASIKQMVAAYGDVTQLGSRALGDGTVISGAGIVEDLQKRLTDVQRFTSLISTLTSQGLNDTALQQLLAAGVDGGLATAEAIAQGGAGAIQQINALQKQIADAGAQLAADTGQTLYGQGVDAAQSIVLGLQNQLATVEKPALAQAMRELGQAAADGIRKGIKDKNGEARQAIRELAGDMKQELLRAWGIHSPSRVFRTIGGQVVAGLTLGLDTGQVRTAGVQLADALAQGFGSPSIGARLDPVAALDVAATYASTQRIEISLTAEQLSALQRGKAIEADRKVYLKAGGRPAS